MRLFKLASICALISFWCGTAFAERVMEGTIGMLQTNIDTNTVEWVENSARLTLDVDIPQAVLEFGSYTLTTDEVKLSEKNGETHVSLKFDLNDQEQDLINFEVQGVLLQGNSFGIYHGFLNTLKDSDDEIIEKIGQPGKRPGKGNKEKVGTFSFREIIA